MRSFFQITLIGFLAMIGSLFYAISFASLSVTAFMAVLIQRLIGDKTTTWQECMEFGSAYIADSSKTFFGKKIDS